MSSWTKIAIPLGTIFIVSVPGGSIRGRLATTISLSTFVPACAHFLKTCVIRRYIHSLLPPLIIAILSEPNHGELFHSMHRYIILQHSLLSPQPSGHFTEAIIFHQSESEVMIQCKPIQQLVDSSTNNQPWSSTSIGASVPFNIYHQALHSQNTLALQRLQKHRTKSN